MPNSNVACYWFLVCSAQPRAFCALLAIIPVFATINDQVGDLLSCAVGLKVIGIAMNLAMRSRLICSFLF